MNISIIKHTEMAPLVKGIQDNNAKCFLYKKTTATVFEVLMVKFYTASIQVLYNENKFIKVLSI